MTRLLIGTSNPSKLSLYREMIGTDFDVVSPGNVLSTPLTIEEDLFDIVGNSQLKSRLFAEASNLMALSDDSGIFIPALGNEPGVAARRWAGQLSGEVSDERWVNYFLSKVDGLTDDQLAATKQQVVTISTPAGDYRTHSFITHGTLLREPSSHGYQEGGPFAAFFRHDKFGKAEIELTPAERNEHHTDLKARILQSAKELMSL